jgi:hypothetical protein
VDLLAVLIDNAFLFGQVGHDVSLRIFHAEMERDSQSTFIGNFYLRAGGLDLQTVNLGGFG